LITKLSNKIGEGKNMNQSREYKRKREILVPSTEGKGV